HSNESIGAIPALDADFLSAHGLLRQNRASQWPLHGTETRAVVAKSDPLVIAVQIWRRLERSQKDLGHLGVDRDESPRRNFRYDNADRHLLLNCMRERPLGDQTQLCVVRRARRNAAL